MIEILLNIILSETNELTIEGCAKLLLTFPLCKEVIMEKVEALWDSCLFGFHTSCDSESAREALFELVLKVCEDNKEVVNLITKKTLGVINDKFEKINLEYSTYVNKRSSTGYAGLKDKANISYMTSKCSILMEILNRRHIYTDCTRY